MADFAIANFNGYKLIKGIIDNYLQEYSKKAMEIILCTVMVGRTRTTTKGMIKLKHNLNMKLEMKFEWRHMEKSYCF